MNAAMGVGGTVQQRDPKQVVACNDDQEGFRNQLSMPEKQHGIQVAGKKGIAEAPEQISAGTGILEDVESSLSELIHRAPADDSGYHQEHVANTAGGHRCQLPGILILQRIFHKSQLREEGNHGVSQVDDATAMADASRDTVTMPQTPQSLHAEMSRRQDYGVMGDFNSGGASTRQVFLHSWRGRGL